MFTHMTGHNNMPPASDERLSPEKREYGRDGIFGILTPQANPTVEAELDILLPPASVTVTARLTSAAPSLRDRLTAYLENLPVTLAGFGDLKLDAIGFACTGSSYLADPADERRIIQPLEESRNCEIVTAAQSVKDACRSLGLRRIALISPYPEWLTAACHAHWERNGMIVAGVLQLPTGSGDRHGIYALTTASVLSAVKAFSSGNADAILVTGTGMPSLRIILELEAERSIPVLSSNLCLAWSLARKRGALLPGSESRLYGGWRERLIQA
jgi:maleate isomerase